MSQPVVSAARPDRPGTVTVAGYLLYLVAAMNLVSAIIAISTFDTQAKASIDAIRQTQATQNPPSTTDPTSFVHTALGVSTAIAFVVAIVFAIIGMFVLRGRQGWRIAAWVLTGLGVLCSGLGVGGGLLASASDAKGAGTTTVDLPSWITNVSRGIALIDLLAFIAIIVLLSLPKSNAYFKPAPLAEPPLPYPGQSYPS
jgi:hypothetical protein